MAFHLGTIQVFSNLLDLPDDGANHGDGEQEARQAGS